MKDVENKCKRLAEGSIKFISEKGLKTQLQFGHSNEGRSSSSSSSIYLSEATMLG